MNRHRGMAMAMAIACVGLLSTALVVSGIALANESRRTNFTAEDAQLRQLLLAGERIAQSRLRAGWTDQAVNVDLPQSLREQGATLTLQLISSGTVEIDASLPKHRMSQRVQFTQQNGDWHVVNADFGN